jgi:hypothetical protein
MTWFLRRLREPSTWRGLVWLATVAGLSLRPDQAEAIVTAGMALAGLLGVFLADEQKPKVPALPPIELQGPAGAGDAWAGADPVRLVDGMRQPVPPVDYPIIGGADDTYPNLPPAGFGDRD